MKAESIPNSLVIFSYSPTISPHFEIKKFDLREKKKKGEKKKGTGYFLLFFNLNVFKK